jgi:hypothetical protein
VRVVADRTGGVLVGHEIVALDQLQSPRAKLEQGAGERCIPNALPAALTEPAPSAHPPGRVSAVH